jgi:hypothetical protein
MGVMGIMGVMRVRRANRAGVAEQAAEAVGEEVREQGGFLEIVGAAGSDEAGPVIEECRMMNDECRRSKARLKPPQCDIRGTSKPPQSLLIAN